MVNVIVILKNRYEMMNYSDALCREYGLSVIEYKSRGNSKNRKQYFGKQSHTKIITQDIDIAIENSNTLEQFKRVLTMEGYQIKKEDEQIVLSHPSFEKIYPLKISGNNYSFENIKLRILEQPLLYKQSINYYSKYHYDITPFFKLYKNNKLSGFQRLYIHWQYLLGILPKNRGTSKYLSKELRKEVCKLESISQEMILLCKNNIF